MEKIVLVDLVRQYKTLEGEILSAIKDVMDKSEFILGKTLSLFEKEWAEFCGTKHSIGVDNGTSALELSLHSLDIGKGDKVILPSFTFFATASAVCYTGAEPVFVDVEQNTANIDIDKLEDAIKKMKDKKLKAIMPVHLYGQPVDIEQILEIGKKYNIPVIEDACQSHGAKYKTEYGRVGSPEVKSWKRAGSMGVTGCFSFYPGKNIGAFGDGGIVVTDDAQIAEKIRMLRDCGRKEKYTHELLGFNKRLDTIQSAILRVKLKHLDKWNESRRNVARQYTELLKGLPVEPIQIKSDREPVYHMYVIRVKKRDELLKYLAGKNIFAGVHYPLPLHLQPCFKFLGCKKGDFPVSEKLADEVLSLPIFPEITDDEVRYVAEEIKNFFKS